MIKGAGEDEWYIVYHRRPLGETAANSRATCIDRMYFDENGYIKPVKMTFREYYPVRLIVRSDVFITFANVKRLLIKYLNHEKIYSVSCVFVLSFTTSCAEPVRVGFSQWRAESVLESLG